MEQLNSECYKKHNAKFIRGSVIDFHLLKKNTEDIDYIFHQACAQI